MEKTPKSIPSRPQDGEQYWKRIDELFFRTHEHAENAFKVNLYVNIIVVAVGVLMLLYSIYYSWTRSLDLYSVAFGGIGVASFVGLFYYKPQLKIQQTVGDLTQIQVVYRTYCAQWENITDWARSNQQHMTLQELDALNKQLEDRTNVAVDKIEKFVGGK
ncbi:TPA: hypothetical protein HA344_06450 [Candidatus Bathyarchaeota archaeon]|nr:hypothetical protein [Candidatus Bathyarchaeota archaeon]